MTDLETRLRALRQLPTSGPNPQELRRRASQRARSRRQRLRGSALVVLVASTVGVFALQDRRDGSEGIVTGPAPGSTSSTAPAPSRTIGDVGAVTVDVRPRAGLRDGDLVEVTVSGLVNLPGATILQCAGDVTEADAQQGCDSSAVDVPGLDHPFPVPAADEQTVSVTRTIHITRESADGNVSLPYDCATEPAGCVLAVGPYELPARAVLVPLAFEDVAQASPALAINPAQSLQDNQDVTLTAQGLRPNATVVVKLCDSEPRQNCSDFTSAATDEGGALATTVTVRAAIYGDYGRSDCVAAACNVVIGNLYGESLAARPVRFAQGVVAPVPQLTIDPPGPYSDQQTVDVSGVNFPPGLDLNGHLGQCPADKDTAVEERCGYDLAQETVVDGRGEFRATIRLYDSLSLTGTCVTGPGCVLAWVIQHGPIAASIPLEFRP